MFDLIDFLQADAFSLLGESVSVIEVIGFVTGALCVWAVTRQMIWNWPVGITNNAAFFMLFIGAGLYADAVLQVIFAGVAAYGWFLWSRRASATGVAVLEVRRGTRRERYWGIAATALFTAGAAILLQGTTDSTVPLPDAFVLAASLLATWGQARKIIEQWWVWIAVDVVSIPLYASKGLWLTAILYVGFLTLCVDGLRRWSNELRDTRSRRQTAEHDPEVVTR
ncbi:nicotinamide riboside transporter PnuC [Agreia sp.]|uniref:nicotinamide riboside transporter PnuC n=1 Tax=Agreia sp. TaxID=1872416 RepID=UPI0035BC2C7F